MTINSHSSGLLSRYSPEQRLSVLNAIAHPGLPHPALTAPLSSPRNEPIAGPSGLPPVQQVPLVTIDFLLQLKDFSKKLILLLLKITVDDSFVATR